MANLSEFTTEAPVWVSGRTYAVGQVVRDPAFVAIRSDFARRKWIDLKDAQLRDRSTHTGTQEIASVAGLQGALDEKASNVVAYVEVSTNTVASAFGRYRLTASLDLTLPPSPSDGDWVEVVNHGDTKTARVLRNGQNINNLAEDITLDLLWVSVRFVFSTGYGWFIA